MKDHYTTLGVPKNASDAAVKRAYRKRASRAHPDKGGNAEDMAALNKAYSVLSDPVRRLRYDQTGDDESIDRQPNEVQALMVEAFTQMLKRNITNSQLEWCEQYLGKKINDLQNQHKTLAAAHRYLEERRSEIKFKGAGLNLYEATIDTELRNIEKAQFNLDHGIETLQLAIKRLQEEYKSTESGIGVIITGSSYTTTITGTSL